MNLQRKKTEMVGTLVVPTDLMTQEAATSSSTADAVHEAMEHFSQDVQRSVNLKNHKTEMCGTLMVDVSDLATPNSTHSPGLKKKSNNWTEPMDEVSLDRLYWIVGAANI